MVSNSELMDEVLNVQQSPRRQRRVSDVSRVAKGGGTSCPEGQCMTAIDPNHSVCKPCYDSWMKAEGEEKSAEAPDEKKGSRILGMKPLNAIMLGVGIVALVLIVKKVQKG